MPATSWGSWKCSTNETPPASLMRLLESQKEFYHLTLQKMAVCRDDSLRILLPPGEPDCDVVRTPSTTAVWAPLARSCGNYQFRRHFAIVIATADGNRGSKAIAVQAALVQSRWDYLRLNWNKKRSTWFWPYAGVSRIPGM